MCVVLYGAVEHWLSGALVNAGDDDDDDDDGIRYQLNRLPGRPMDLSDSR